MGSPSTSGSLDFKPTSFDLIAMKLAMHLLLVLLHRCFLNFLKYSKISPPRPPVNLTLEIGSPDFKPICICFITMKYAMRLLLVLPHSCFLEFSKNFTTLPPVDRTLEIGSSYFRPIYIGLITMKLAVRLFFVLPHKWF